MLLADARLCTARSALHRDPQARLYLGLGMAGRALSEGLALDVLALLALVEHLRRASQRGHATVLIADTNAWAAGYPKALVRDLAQRYLDQTRKLCAHLGAQIDVRLASNWTLLQQDVSLPRAAQRTAPYVRVQLEQMVALAKEGYRIKVGWRMPGAKRDEMHFDALYREHLEDPKNPQRLQTIYGLAGRSFDNIHPRACPYISYADTKRILLTDHKTVREQIAWGLVHQGNATRGYRRHLIKIARGLRPIVAPELADLPALELLETCKRAAQG